MRTKGDKLLCVFAAAVMGCLGACSSSTRVEGKVIEGDVSFVGTIDASDERLKAPGLAGASINIFSARTGASIGRAASGAGGDYSIGLGGFNTLSGQLDIVSTLDGYAPSRGLMSTPTPERRVLIVLKRGQPQGGAAPGTP